MRKSAFGVVKLGVLSRTGAFVSLKMSWDPKELSRLELRACRLFSKFVAFSTVVTLWFGVKSPEFTFLWYCCGWN
jgi:hypothetical protein